MFHKEDEEFSSWQYVMISWMKTITTLQGAFDGLEYDKDEVDMLTTKWKETAYNMCFDAKKPRESYYWYRLSS